MSSRPGLHLPSLLQLIISGAGFTISLSALSLFLLIGLINLASGEYNTTELRMLLTLTWISALIGLLMLPSILLSGCRLMNIRAKGLLSKVNGSQISTQRGHRISLKLTGGLMILFPALILAGEYISQQDILAWLLMPPLSLVVIIIPLWWVYQIGSRGLESGSPQRQWGLVSVGLIITPWVVMLAELFLILIVSGILLLWLSSQPGFIENLNSLSQSLMERQMNPDMIIQTLRPYLQRPLIIITSLLVAAGLVPMLEELLKPLGMWGLAIQKTTPQEGFSAGLICGGTFAMLESLGMLAGFTGEGWALVAIGRMGTGILHSLATALTGWGLAVAWGKREYIKSVEIFLVSVTLHAMWNAFSLTMAIEPFLNTGSGGNPILTALPSVSPAIIIVMIILLLALLIGSNRILRREQAAVIPG